MKKEVLYNLKKMNFAIITLIITVIFMSTSINSFAASVSDTKRAILTAPKTESFSTTNSTVVIAGTGQKNDKVRIELYTKKGESFSELQTEIELVVDALGIFSKEVQLFPGENKIVVTLSNAKGEISESRFINYIKKIIEINEIIRGLDVKNSPSVLGGP